MGTASSVGLLTGALSLAREPARLTLRLWELGFSSAASAARLGLELLDPSRSGAPDLSQHRSPSHPDYPGNGGPPATGQTAPDVERGGPAEPDVVVPETGYLAPEPGEVGPEPDVLDVESAAGPAGSAASAADAAPALPDELVPDHLEEEPVLVAEAAEKGAEDGAGPELHIDEPWKGYDQMTAADVRARLSSATTAQAAAVELYEASRKGRSSVLEAAGRALRR
jgi:hypothetical protein